MTEMTVVTWQEIENLTEKLLNQIKKFELDATGKWIEPFDGIVGLTRGGLIPAIILSHKLGLPVMALNYSSKSGQGDKHHCNQIPSWFSEGRWIVVDDIVDSGYTFKELAMRSLNSRFACLHHRHSSTYSPDYSALLVVGDSWIQYPWEK